MKIDVEGYEINVFRGIDFNAAYAPQNIIMEYFLKRAPLAPGSTKENLAACCDLLGRNGYKSFTVTGEPFDPASIPPEHNVWWRREP